MNYVDSLIEIVGQQNVLTNELAAGYLTDWRERFVGKAIAVVRPANTDEVAQIVRWCNQNKIPLVTQGGNTGLCGGATPDLSGNSIVMSLTRLNNIRDIDLDNDTMVVEAGCILQDVQNAAQQAGRLFPLSLAAEGSCTIGGNLATNAGGTQVLRYGNARDLTLGLEVVTAQGEIMHTLRGLRKDNTGYDLKNLYVGSEGTLGVITAATLKLYPQPVAQCTALLAVDSIADAVKVLSVARSGFGPALTGFELIAGNCLHAVVECYPEQRIPFQGDAVNSPWFALLELSDSESEEHARQRFEEVLGLAIEQGLVSDAVIAESMAQSAALWHLRESIPLAEKAFGKAIKHDVSIPVSKMTDFVETTNKIIQDSFPSMKHIIFGHLGDGNLHYNLAIADDWPEDKLLAQQDAIYKLVHDSVHSFNGSISAEHGVGQLKRNLLPDYKDPVEMDIMRKIKAALDPDNILNPGKVV